MRHPIKAAARPTIRIVVDVENFNKDNANDLLIDLHAVRGLLGHMYDVGVRITEKDYNSFPHDESRKCATIFGYPLEIKKEQE